jgi:hypothetical protein
MTDYRSPEDDWRNIPIALIDTEKGEGKAQACDIACLQQLSSKLLCVQGDLMDVGQILSQPEREWRAQGPASEAEIALLASKARVDLPSEYVELLRFSNGGEGPLALRPLWFRLYSVKDCIDLCHTNQHVLEQFPTLMFFGSNGGLESIAFDLREGPPWPIVMIDQIAGPESARPIAPNMAAFIEAIGLDTDQ